MPTEIIRRAALTALNEGAAFALWRLPDADDSMMLIGLPGAWDRRAIDFADSTPGFTASRYDNFDGDAAEFIRADLILRGDDIRYVTNDGSEIEDAQSAEQQAFVNAMQATDPAAPFTAPEIAEPPVITGQAHYEGLVRKTLDEIATGRLEKAVGSRAVPVDLEDGADLLELFNRLAARYPTAFVCLSLIPGIGCWIVATPERLLSVDREGARTMALAGTQTLAADADVEAVAWRGKFIEEQALVCRYMRDRFHACGFHSYREAGPRTVRAANLAHLRSVFTVPAGSGDFADDTTFRRACNALLREMHPTSAVCGMPRQEAIDFLEREEGYDRSYYCGFLGPMNIGGASDLFVNLRAAQVIGRTIYLYVGAGLVDGSVPEDEWQETVEKSKTLGAVIAEL